MIKINLLCLGALLSDAIYSLYHLSIYQELNELPRSLISQMYLKPGGAHTA